MKINILAVLMLILLSLAAYATASGNITQFGNDETNKKWVDDLKKDGFSNEEIAKEIIYQISLSQTKVNSTQNQKLTTDEKIQEILNQVDIIEVDDALQSAMPYYWVLLIADDKQKEIFISEIEKSEISDKDKNELKSRLLEIWEKYPMKFEKIGHTTYISPDTKNQVIVLTDSENLTLQQMDMIHSFKDDIIIITPKWAVSPTHYYLVYYAALNSGYPDPVTAAQHSGDPDMIYSWEPPVMWYNPDLHVGGAPGMAQQSFEYARNFYQLGYTSDASIQIGSASHFLTDVGNPLHTGRETDQIIDKFFHPFGDDIHSLYESYISNNWSDFNAYVMGNQYSYKWAWNGADASTIQVATSSHRFVDTLYVKIYNNRAGFWNEDYWTREITRVCLMTSSQYTNGMMNALMLKTFPGCSNLPTDPDMDGDIEDINGNSLVDFDDVVMYFQNMEWIRSNEPIVPFDYNNNGYIDFNDIVLLFNEI